MYDANSHHTIELENILSVHKRHIIIHTATCKMSIFRNLFTCHTMYVIAVFLFTVADQYQQVTILEQYEFLCHMRLPRNSSMWSGIIDVLKVVFIQVHCQVINSNVL